MSIQPYLFFNGRCEEACDFYREALGAQVTQLMRFDDSPVPAGVPLPPDWGRKVMHSSLQIGDATIMASDGHACGVSSFGGFCLSLGAADAAQAGRWFTALSAGGEVRMPLSATFFSPCFGMVTDRFGVGWMVMVAPEAAATADDQRELVLERVLNAPRDKVYRAWTEPALLKQWFTPKPWTTVHVENDLRAGGASLVVMRSPEGQEFPNPGVYLEVVPNERLVFTDAFVKAWVPSAKAFMVGTLSFEDAGAGKTKYTARVRHWSVADREQHEKMGFHQGWGLATDQLEALAATL